MLNVGIIGLDTSHSEKFAALIDGRDDCQVSAVWDANGIRDRFYLREFAARYNAELLEEPADAIEHVDVAMILTVNWDYHRPLAELFVRAGIPTLIDKPMAGTIDDVRAMQRVATSEDTTIFSGSALPYHPALSGMRSDTGVHNLFSVGYNSPFYYGVHLTDTARKICGSDWQTVEPGPHSESTTVTFENGSTAILRFDGPTNDGVFGLLDIGDTVRTAQINGAERELDRMYDPFIDRFLETVVGNHATERWVFDAATLLLAVQATLSSEQTITPESPELDRINMDGDAFAEEYEPLY